MPALLSDDIKSLVVDGPNFAHLATLIPGGSPRSVPVWVGRGGEQLLMRTGETSLKAKNGSAIPAWHCQSLTSTIPAKFSFEVM